MINVQNLIEAWEEKLNDYPKEHTTARLIRNTVTALELMQSPLSEQDKKDLDLIHRVRSGEVKKSICRDYAIYNGKWYREHPWNPPFERETPPRILSLEELRECPTGIVLWQDLFGEWGENAAVLPVVFDGFGPSILDEKVESFLFPQGTDPVEDYGKNFVLWTGRPTDQQRKEAREK